MASTAMGLSSRRTISRMSSPGLAIAMFTEFDGSRRSRAHASDSTCAGKEGRGYFAAQVGIDSANVAEELEYLEHRGIVKRSRNSVTIADQEALTQRACSCFVKATEAVDDYLRNLADFAQRYNSRPIVVEPSQGP